METRENVQKNKDGGKPGRDGRGERERKLEEGGGLLQQMALLASDSLLNLFLLFFSCAQGFNPVVTCVPAWL